MRGMSATTGKALQGIEHLTQRLIDVLTTPIGSRVMRRDYGSRLYELIDQPVDASWSVKVYGAIAEALRNPENGLHDFRLDRMRLVDVAPDGHAQLELAGVYLPTQESITTGVRL